MVRYETREEVKNDIPCIIVMRRAVPVNMSELRENLKKLRECEYFDCKEIPLSYLESGAIVTDSPILFTCYKGNGHVCVPGKENSDPYRCRDFKPRKSSMLKESVRKYALETL
jgi:hypothetical protein